MAHCHSIVSEHHSQFTTDAMPQHSQQTPRSIHYMCKATASPANTTVSSLHMQSHRIASKHYSQFTTDAMPQHPQRTPQSVHCRCNADQECSPVHQVTNVLYIACFMTKQRLASHCSSLAGPCSSFAGPCSNCVGDCGLCAVYALVGAVIGLQDSCAVIRDALQLKIFTQCSPQV